MYCENCKINCWFVGANIKGKWRMEKQQIYEILNECYFSEDCHEKDVLENIGRLVKKGGVFVDIGASLGQFTRYAAAYFGQSKIFSVEADPVRYEELERNCRKWESEFSVPIQAVHSAVASTDTDEVTFYTTNSNVSGALCSHPVGGDVSWQPISVPAVTLDSIFPDDPPDFVKVDIEGGEYKMLLGAKGILRKKKTVFLIELHRWNDADGIDPGKESSAILSSFGYHSVRFYDKHLFLPVGYTYFREKAYSPFRKLKTFLQAK
jgi:FkbM family methyltransferase